MKEYLISQFWHNTAMHLNVGADDAKNVIQNAYLRVKTGTCKKSDFAPKIWEALRFYIDNYEIIENL